MVRFLVDEDLPRSLVQAMNDVGFVAEFRKTADLAQSHNAKSQTRSRPQFLRLHSARMATPLAGPSCTPKPSGMEQSIARPKPSVLASAHASSRR